MTPTHLNRTANVVFTAMRGVTLIPRWMCGIGWLAALIWLGSIPSALAQTDPLGHWTEVLMTPTPYPTAGMGYPGRKSIAYGGGKFVVTEGEGVSDISTDATNWSQSGTDLGVLLPRDITYVDGSGFFEVANNNSSLPYVILNSLDAVSWSSPLPPLPQPVPSDLVRVAHGNGRLVVAGELQKGVNSASWVMLDNGTNWENGGSPSIIDTIYPTRLIYTGHEFMLVGYDNGDFHGVIYASTTGTNWAQVYSWNRVGSELLGVAYGNGQYVAVGNMNGIVTSSDGTHWTQVSAPGSGVVNDRLRNVAYGDGAFVAVGYQAASVGGDVREYEELLTSSDGTNWTQRTMSHSITNGAAAYYAGLDDVVLGDNRFVAVSPVGTAYVSDPLLSFNRVPPVTTNSINGMASSSSTLSSGSLVAVGGGGTILHSGKGTNWTQVSDSGTTNDLNGAAEGNGQVVAVGDGGTVLSSANGDTWQSIVAGISNRLSGIAFGSGMFVAVGDLGAVLTSTNGETWVNRSLATSNNLSGITFGNGTFLALEVNGELLQSADATSWMAYPIEHGEPRLVSITFDPGKSQFVGADGNGDIYTSPDGVTWSATGLAVSGWTPNATGQFAPIFVSGGQLLAGGANGTILTAPWSNPGSAPTDQALYSVAYGNGRFAAVGEAGTLLTSADGTSWSVPQNYVQLGNAFNCITYGDGEFVAVGDGGTTVTSTDATNWMVLSSGATVENLYGITRANGLFVAVGDNGSIITSPDGNTWAAQDSGSSDNDDLRGVVWGNGRFVAVGNSSNESLVSPDGTNWVEGGNGLSSGYLNLTYGNGLFVATAYFGGSIFTSTDGTNWTEQGSFYPESPNAVGYGNGTFVIAGDAGILYASTDATNWVKLLGGTEDQQESLYGIAYNGTFFTMVGDGGTTLTASQNGISHLIPPSILDWSAEDSGSSDDDNLQSVAWGNGRFVSVGNSSAESLVSTNGTDWVQGGSGLTDGYMSLTYGGGFFVAASYFGGSLFTSTDGLSWTKEASFGVTLNGVAYGDGYSLAFGKDGSGNSRIFKRLSSGQWTALATTGIASGDSLNAVTYADNQFMALSDNDVVYASSNGVDWVEADAGIPANTGLNGITYGNGQFVAVGGSGVIEISTNGMTWTSPTNTYVGAENELFSVAYGNGKFVAVGDNGWMAVSPDGTHWVSRNSPSVNPLRWITYADSRFVAVGDNATVIETAPFVAPTLSQIVLQPNGRVEVAAKGTQWENLHLQVSTNLLNWTSVGGVTLTNGSGQVTDPSPTTLERFYRARLDP